MPKPAPWWHGGEPALLVLDAPFAHGNRIAAGRRGVSIGRAA